jgi:hypothetical protein
LSCSCPNRPCHHPYPLDPPPPLVKKAPSRMIRRGFSVSSPHLIFQGEFPLLELAPASRLKRNRLLWLHRASPSATLDKKVFLNLQKSTDALDTCQSFSLKQTVCRRPIGGYRSPDSDQSFLSLSLLRPRRMLPRSPGSPSRPFIVWTNTSQFWHTFIFLAQFVWTSP